MLSATTKESIIPIATKEQSDFVISETLTKSSQHGMFTSDSESTEDADSPVTQDSLFQDSQPQVTGWVFSPGSLFSKYLAFVNIGMMQGLSGKVIRGVWQKEVRCFRD